MRDHSIGIGTVNRQESKQKIVRGDSKNKTDSYT